jgi:hypothetical protein
MTDCPGPEVETLTIRIPMRLQRRGGRKLIIAPERKPSRDETLIKALVRAHHWRRKMCHRSCRTVDRRARRTPGWSAPLGPDRIRRLF